MFSKMQVMALAVTPMLLVAGCTPVRALFSSKRHARRSTPHDPAPSAPSTQPSAAPLAAPTEPNATANSLRFEALRPYHRVVSRVGHNVSFQYALKNTGTSTFDDTIVIRGFVDGKRVKSRARLTARLRPGRSARGRFTLFRRDSIRAGQHGIKLVASFDGGTCMSDTLGFRVLPARARARRPKGGGAAAALKATRGQRARR